MFYIFLLCGAFSTDGVYWKTAYYSCIVCDINLIIYTYVRVCVCMYTLWFASSKAENVFVFRIRSSQDHWTLWFCLHHAYVCVSVCIGHNKYIIQTVAHHYCSARLGMFSTIERLQYTFCRLENWFSLRYRAQNDVGLCKN